MDAHQLKAEIEKNIEKLATLRDEVKLKLHLATLDAKQEWDEKLSPRVFEIEQTAKDLTESSHTGLQQVIERLEDFLARLRERAEKGEHRPTP